MTLNLESEPSEGFELVPHPRSISSQVEQRNELPARTAKSFE
jgi:hypothetical protein